MGVDIEPFRQGGFPGDRHRTSVRAFGYSGRKFGDQAGVGWVWGVGLVSFGQIGGGCKGSLDIGAGDPEVFKPHSDIDLDLPKRLQGESRYRSWRPRGLKAHSNIDLDSPKRLQGGVSISELVAQRSSKRKGESRYRGVGV